MTLQAAEAVIDARRSLDVVTLHAHSHQSDPGGVAVTAAPSTARVIARLEKIHYAKRADRVVIRHGRECVVCIIKIVSPGNEDSRNAIRMFVEKAADRGPAGQAADGRFVHWRRPADGLRRVGRDRRAAPFAPPIPLGRPLCSGASGGHVLPGLDGIPNLAEMHP